MANPHPKPPNAGKGRRPGTKNKRTLEKEALREELRRHVAPQIRELVTAQLAQALGIRYLVARNKRTGEFRKLTEKAYDEFVKRGHAAEEVIEVWAKDPSTQAASMLLDRVMDKPKEQPQELHVKGDWDARVALLRSARAVPD